MKLTKREMKMYALLKWRFIAQHAPISVAENGGTWVIEYLSNLLEKAYPIMSSFVNHCSYCSLYYSSNEIDYHNRGCPKCPVLVNKQPCYNRNHPFSEYIGCPSRDKAMQVLEVVKKIKVPDNGKRKK